MKMRLVVFGLSLGIVAASQTACSNQNQDNTLEAIDQDSKETGDNAEGMEQDNNTDGTATTMATDKEIDTEEADGDVKADNEAVMEEFASLSSGENVIVADVIAFVQENMEAVSKENMSTMLLKLEELQIAYRTELEEKYLPQDIQTGLLEAMLSDVDYRNPENLKDEKQKALVQETRDNGYTVDHAEGFVFPIVDYTIYEEFRAYATEDIAEYYQIMAIESMNPFAKDAALMIEWEEIINRALQAEAFLTNFNESIKAEEVEMLYQRYETIALFGLNNTPLFDYEENTMEVEAKVAYEKAIASANGSEFLEKLNNYMDLLAKNDYKLTEEVTEYRDTLVK